jgi:hypothetical protein
MSEMPHDASDTEYKSWNRVSRMCTDPSAESTHYYMGDLLCGCSSYLHAVKQTRREATGRSTLAPSRRAQASV